MFDNIGKKIKYLASFFCGIGIVLAWIIGIIMISYGASSYRYEEWIPIGICVCILGSIISWIGSFFLYGYGQLIENTDKMVASQNTSVTCQIQTKNNTDKIVETINQKAENQN